ncbi:MAG: iron-containing alcohol dehydrogenase, partial [Pseudomonadota bacterium]|nr:iron-containing alcohol dehydrogenase [Pseudomonadota bacterium]
MFQLKVLFYKLVMVFTRLLVMLLPENKPTVFSGPGSSLQLADSMAQLGAKKVLVVTDKILVELGLIDPIKARLEEQGVEVAIFDGVEPDPSFKVVDAGLAALKQERADSLLAVGGGSSIDAAKVIALAAGNDKTPKQLEGKFKARKPALPLYAIPTTAGTGSEVTVAAVITDTELDQKCLVLDPKGVPLAAALDPEIMKGMPAPITAATGMDALTHAVEAYISRFAEARTDAYAVAAIRMIMSDLTKAYDDGSDIKARSSMALASYYAGMAFTKAFVGYVHAIAHQFGAKYHTPHGLANAIVLPHILEYSKPAVAHRLGELAIECGLGERSES